MFVYYLNVPQNKVGIEEFESFDEEMPNVKTFELTQEEYEVLRQPKGLFQIFDEKFGTIIDVCEEERIDSDDLKEALQLAEKMLSKQKNDIAKDAYRKIVDSLECAVNAGTFWEIDIYLE